MSALSFRPVTEKTLDDFVALFEAKGGPSYCWCMAYRGTPQEKKATAKGSLKRQMLGRIRKGTKVGLLGYADGEPVAWVSIAPRDTYQSFGTPEPETDEVIWSLACMYVKRTHRKRGYSDEMVEAAADYAAKSGATILEASPVDADSPSYRFMGFVPLFERAEFKKSGDIGTRRHLMRKHLGN